MIRTDNKYLDFIEKVKESKNAEDFKRTFHLAYYDRYSTPVFYHNLHDIFELDEEDMKYLYNKYSKRLQEEMQDSIKEIKNAYETL